MKTSDDTRFRGCILKSDRGVTGRGREALWPHETSLEATIEHRGNATSLHPPKERIGPGTGPQKLMI